MIMFPDRDEYLYVFLPSRLSSDSIQSNRYLACVLLYKLDRKIVDLFRMRPTQEMFPTLHDFQPRIRRPRE
jgi:hypothetical protein